MRKLLVILGLIIMILIPASIIGVMIGSMLNSKGNSEKAKKDQTLKKVLKNVKVSLLSPSTLNDYIVGEGRVVSSNQIIVGAEASGKLYRSSIKLQKGSSFKKGQVLFRIDNNEARLNIVAQKSTFLNTLGSSLADLKIDYPDSYKNWETFFNSLDVEKTFPDLPKISNSKEKVFVASKNIITQYYNIKSAEEQLRRYYYVAPFSGSIVNVYAQQGISVNIGSQVIEIIPEGNLEVEVPLASSLSERLKIKDKVTLIDELQKKEYNGTLVRVGNYINPSTQSVPVFIKVDNVSKNEIYSGMYLKAKINMGDIDKVNKLPNSSLVDNQIYVMQEDSTIHLKPIEVLSTYNDSILIRGLEKEQFVVTGQALDLKPNQKINPIKD